MTYQQLQTFNSSIARCVCVCVCVCVLPLPDRLHNRVQSDSRFRSWEWWWFGLPLPRGVAAFRGTGHNGLSTQPTQTELANIEHTKRKPVDSGRTHNHVSPECDALDLFSENRRHLANAIGPFRHFGLCRGWAGGSAWVGGERVGAGGSGCGYISLQEGITTSR